MSENILPKQCAECTIIPDYYKCNTVITVCYQLISGNFNEGTGISLSKEVQFAMFTTSISEFDDCPYNLHIVSLYFLSSEIELLKRLYSYLMAANQENHIEIKTQLLKMNPKLIDIFQNADKTDIDIPGIIELWKEFLNN